MHSISALARNSGLPRRTVQYWHDQEIIQPLSRDPVVYDDNELVIVRLLVPFANLTVSISAVRELARIFRLSTAGDISTPNDADAVEAFRVARAGKTAYLCIAMELVGKSEPWVWTKGIQSLADAPQAIRGLIGTRENLAVSIVDLRYAFDTRLTTGALIDEADSD